MEVKIVKRKFIYKEKELPDIPGIHENEVIKVLSGNNPELLNATIKYEGIKDGFETYQISTNAGVKG